MMYGLDAVDVNRITSVFASFPEVKKVILYGSRAKGNFREGSDIDICLAGERLNLTLLNEISQKLYDLNLPYLFDIAIYHQISNQELKEHINRVGVLLFEGNK